MEQRKLKMKIIIELELNEGYERFYTNDEEMLHDIFCNEEGLKYNIIKSDRKVNKPSDFLDMLEILENEEK
jgi:hypothetical protein